VKRCTGSRKTWANNICGGQAGKIQQVLCLAKTNLLTSNVNREYQILAVLSRVGWLYNIQGGGKLKHGSVISEDSNFL